MVNFKKTRFITVLKHTMDCGEFLAQEIIEFYQKLIFNLAKFYNLLLKVHHFQW